VVSGDIFISRISRRGKRVRVANARCVTHVHEDVDGTSKGGLSIQATCQYVVRLNIENLY
jgi:hypothetical protein